MKYIFWVILVVSVCLAMRTLSVSRDTEDVRTEVLECVSVINDNYEVIISCGSIQK